MLNALFDLAKGHVFILFLSYFILLFPPFLVIVMFCNHVASAHFEKKKKWFLCVSEPYFLFVCVCVRVFSYKCPNYVLQKMRIKTIFFTTTLRSSVCVFLSGLLFFFFSSRCFETGCQLN